MSLAGHPVGDDAARRRYLGRTVWITVPAMVSVLAAAPAIVPELQGMEQPAARLALATRWLLVALLPYAAVALWILWARFAEGAHDPTAGVESERLKIHCRVMQNTLEQLAWLAVCVLALATLLPAPHLQLLPVACTLFAASRFTYWWGYLRDGTLGRRVGVQLTFTLNVYLLAKALLLFVRQLAA